MMTPARLVIFRMMIPFHNAKMVDLGEASSMWRRPGGGGPAPKTTLPQITLSTQQATVLASLCTNS
jgi:hypothetical protein